MFLIVTFDLKTRQLNAVNAFLNAENDENVYCQMLDEYRMKNKMLKLIKIFMISGNHHYCDLKSSFSNASN